MRRHAMLLSLAAVLLLTMSVPAIAKKGGHPGPPSGAGLEVTVEPSSGFMWANSVDDQILFDITVTNRSGVDLAGVAVEFGGEPLATVDLEKNGSWAMEYPYTVVTLAGLPVSQQSQVTVGIVKATAADETTDSAAAVMTAYPILPCAQSSPGGSFTFGPKAEYSECSFTADPGTWTLTTTLAKPPRGKSSNPSATVRDGVPGNWCDYDENGPLQPGEYLEIDVWKLESYIYLPSDGTCLHGGAGGDEIPVRNTDTFYLATWTDNTVDAGPSS